MGTPAAAADVNLFWAAIGGEAYRQWLLRTGGQQLRDGDRAGQDGESEPTPAACIAAITVVD